MTNINISDEERINFERLVEEEIKSNQKEFRFEIREYTLKLLLQDFNPDRTENSEIFIPDYQRDFVWDEKNQSLFIESLLINLPIPYIFVADIDTGDESTGRIEVVDGSQRLRTMHRFVNNELKLQNLEKIKSLEGKFFNDLSLARQLKFMRTSIRMIELTEIDEDGRRVMFKRLNTGGVLLRDMEERRGTQDSNLLTLIEQLSQDLLFKKLLPLSQTKIRHKDDLEYILRFLAYSHDYENFDGNVKPFLNNYVEKNKNISEQETQLLSKDFLDMLMFIDKNFEFGFRKSASSNFVPRVRFEAISSGVALALRAEPSLITRTDIITDWVVEPEFHSKVSEDGANSRPKVKDRFEFVRDKILEQV